MKSVFRKVAQIIEPQQVIEGAGVLLRRSFGPSRDNPIEGPPVGFPMHPHRGIETVTYMIEGSVRHRDSLGNMGVIGAGEVQWMSSGGGIMHEEMPKAGPSGVINGFQLWVNLPAAEKMSQPRYQEIDAKTIPVVEKEGVGVRVVAGEYEGVQGAVTDIAAQPLYMEVNLDPGADFGLPVPAGHTLVVYLFEGEGIFGLDDAESGAFLTAVSMAIFEDGDNLKIQAGPGAPARFMVMAGRPFHEPIVPYGPFVMNTEAEIQQAFIDLRNGTFVKS